jgi:PIN domain nuclease of toxin-antitoxin system
LNYAFDACAMIAYIEGEPGQTVVATLLADPTAICYAHSMNLCEVYYQIVRRSGIPTARAAIAALYSDGVIERRDMSRHFWQRVGEHKSRGGISLPDCFCITLAQELSGEVVTSDHGEFDPLVPLGIVPIKFIR